MTAPLVESPRPAVACHALAVVHAVAEPRRTASVLIEELGFCLREAEGEDAVLVDNGAVGIRLVRAAGLGRDLGPPLELEVETEDLELASGRLRAQVGATRVDADRRLGGNRLVRRIELGADLVVRLTKVLTEDDLGVLPPLPATLEWRPEADRVVRRVLRSVPLVFRRGARRRVTQRAEAIARERAGAVVDLEAAVRGLVDATPRFQHGGLRRALAEEGVDLARYEDGSEGDDTDGADGAQPKGEGT